MKSIQVVSTLGSSKNQTLEKANCQTHGPFQQRTFWALGRKIIKKACPKCTEIILKKKEDEKLREETLARKKQIQNSGIPHRFAETDFKTFDSSEECFNHNLKLAQQYVEHWERVKNKGTCLVFLGNIGTGKTHLSSVIGLELIRKYGAKVHFTTALKLVRSIKETFSLQGSDKETEQSVMNRFINYDLLIIDEIGRQFKTDFEKNILFEVVNGRYNRAGATFIISNEEIKTVCETISTAALDRMRENGGKVLEFKGQSRRK